MIRLLPLLLVLASACSTTYQARAVGDGAGSRSDFCNGTVRTIAPMSEGQSNFYFRDDIVFSVTERAEEARISLQTADGSAIEGNTWVDDQVDDGEPIRVVFTPDQPLAPDTEHIATLDYCGKRPSVRFQTSTLGLPIESPDAVSGWTYAIDLSNATVSKPGIGAQALLTLVDNHLALQVNDLTDDTIDVTIAPTDAATGEQDTCIPTLNAGMPNNFQAAPTFLIGPVDVPFALAGYSIRLYDAIATATFASDGAFFAGGTIAGSIDGRDIVDALAGKDILPYDSPETVCDVIANAKLPCTPCADGEPYCLYLEVRDVVGRQTGTRIQTVNALDCHGECEKSCENDACEAADEFPICSL